jgi:hypothetical protein
MIERIKEIIEEQGLKKKCRKQHIIHKRAYLFNLLRKHGLYFREIGEMFNLDHTTILHGCKMAELHNGNNDELYLLDTLELQREFENVEVIIEERNLVEDVIKCRNMNQLLIIQGRLKNFQYKSFNNRAEY